ncbi:hypothetical protein WMY93_026705 [Mugilogobius chulae]|uniref:R-spondin Fu-CRD domain-containing protein n=1 Tax=Mugilogobius chulae TaxID=88201 RepID=A0AAW0MZC1_9GOBI
MQLGLVALAIVFLSSMGHSDRVSKVRRQRRVSTEGPPSCPKGCDRCSEYNGCVKCNPKLFIFLERNDIRQIGVCLASCPAGYFGMRNPEGNNRCTQCKVDNCETCFNRNFCTKCKEGLYSHSGRCYVSCPSGQQPANATMECTDPRVADCELSEWSQWSTCIKKNKTCGFKKGSQTRVRVPLGLAPSTGPSSVSSPACTPSPRRGNVWSSRRPVKKPRSKQGFGPCCSAVDENGGAIDSAVVVCDGNTVQCLAPTRSFSWIQARLHNKHHLLFQLFYILNTIVSKHLTGQNRKTKGPEQTLTGGSERAPMGEAEEEEEAGEEKDTLGQPLLQASPPALSPNHTWLLTAVPSTQAL